MLGAATIALVYAAAKKMWPGDRGRWAGVMAAVLLAFSFVHVRESQNAVTDAPMAFFVVVAFLAVLAVYQGGSMRSYALAGFLCGIAVATKLSALPVILSLPLAHFLGRRPGEWLGTRPLVGAATIDSVLGAAARTGAATAARRPSDSVREELDDGSTRATDRRRIWLVETPQVFSRSILTAAHEKARALGWTATDDAALVEMAGQAVEVVETKGPNLKITTASDLELARLLLSARSQ